MYAFIDSMLARESGMQSRKFALEVDRWEPISHEGGGD